MGNRFSRRRDTPASSGETATQEPATPPAAPAAAAAAAAAEEESGITQTQEATTENLDVVVGDPVTPVVCLPAEACVAESKEVKAPATPNDAAPESVAKEETPAPAQPEPLVSISEPSPPELEPVAEPEPVVEAQLAPGPAPEPVPEPEPISQPEAEAEAEAVPEPIAEAAPVPAESLEQQTDMATHESLSEPELVSPPSMDLGVSDDAHQPVNTSPSDPDDADKPSDIPMTEECKGSIEAVESSTLEPEKPEETTESVEKPTEVEAAENLEQLVSDVNEENISGLLQNLELKGNDLVADLIPSDVKIPDDTPITDISMSTELM